MRNIAIAICFISALQAHAQTNAVATIDTNFQVVLPLELQMANAYTIDISGINFKNRETCEMFFNTMHEAVVNYVVNYDNKTVTLSLSYDERNKGWTSADWNTYFAARAKKMAAVYAKLNAD